MSFALHLIDSRTPRDCLDQLALLAGADDRIVSLGPPPYTGALALPAREVHCPLGVARLAVRRASPLALGAEVIHVWSAGALSAGIALARRVGAKAVLSLPCLPPGGERPSLARRAKEGLIVIVPTVACQQGMVRAGLPMHRACVLLPPAAPVEDPAALRGQTRRRLGLTEHEKLLVAPMEMVFGSGHKYASWVHAILRQVRTDVRLLMPGGGEAAPQVRFFAATTGYDSEVLFPGKGMSTAAALAAADVALLLCQRDCGTAAMAAAMAAGAPIVASDTPDIRELSGGGRRALLCPPQDPRQASATVLRLLEDADLAATLGAAARQFALQELCPPLARRRLRDVYAS